MYAIHIPIPMTHREFLWYINRVHTISHPFSHLLARQHQTEGRRCVLYIGHSIFSNYAFVSRNAFRPFSTSLPLQIS